jgi:hypothetical protein
MPYAAKPSVTASSVLSGGALRATAMRTD